MTRSITSNQEAASWIHTASQQQPDATWILAKKNLQKMEWEKHGDDAHYDDGDIRFILWFADIKEFLQVLSALAKKAQTDDKIFIGGAWKESDKEQYGIRLSQTVARHLQNAIRDQSFVIDR